MAVRDDFTAGEVLAAADLNDTFASKPPFAYGTATPSTTVEGFIWYDENDTPPTAKFWDGSAFEPVSPPGGLVHIATESFSAVSSVSLNDVFTSAYDNYRLVLQANNSGSGSFMRFRFRAANTDLTAANYGHSLYGFQYGGSDAVVAHGATDTLLTLSFQSSTSVIFTTCDIVNPQLTARTSILGQSVTGDRSQPLGATMTVTDSFDGFTLFPNTGTTTGVVRVYGYQNS
jgi:hypothetical protein